MHIPYQRGRERNYPIDDCTSSYIICVSFSTEESSNTSHVVDPALSHEGIQTTGYETSS